VSFRQPRDVAKNLAPGAFSCTSAGKENRGIRAQGSDPASAAMRVRVSR